MFNQNENTSIKIVRKGIFRSETTSQLGQVIGRLFVKYYPIFSVTANKFTQKGYELTGNFEFRMES